MKMGISAWSVQKLLFSKKIDLREFLNFAKNNVVDNVELLDCFWTEDETAEKIKKYADEIKLSVCCYSISNNFVKEKPEERLKQIEYVKQSIDMATMLETGNLRIFSGNPQEGITYEQGKAWIIESMKECAAYAGEKGVTLVLENHGLFAGKSSQVKEIIETVDSKFLKANVDTGNFLLVGENPLDAVKGLTNYIGFVHFKDFKKSNADKDVYVSLNGIKYQGTILGEGEVPLKEIVDYLDKNDYKGYLSIEYEGIEDPFEGTSKSIEYLKSLIR